MLNNKKGFSLVEFLIVLVLAGIAMTAFIVTMQDRGLAQKKESIQKQHIEQFRMLVNAASNWSATNFADLTDDTPGEVSVSVLKDENFLPVQFAFQYSNAVATDMLGLEFKVYFSKKALTVNGTEKQVVRMLVTVDQDADWQGNWESFVPTKFADILEEEDYLSFIGAWYQNLAVDALDVNLVAGRLKKNSSTVVGPNQSWKVVLDPTDFPVPQRPYQRAVFFIGWPEINGIDDGVGITNPPVDGGVYASCRISQEPYRQEWTVGPNFLGTTSMRYEPDPHGWTNNQCLPAAGERIVHQFVAKPNQPSEIINAPGIGTLFSYVSQESISTLSSQALGCQFTGDNYCKLIYPYDPSDGSPWDTYCNPYGKVSACDARPIKQYTLTMSVAGADFMREDIFRYGAFVFGYHNGNQHAVNDWWAKTHVGQFALCCPNDVPDLP